MTDIDIVLNQLDIACLRIPYQPCIVLFGNFFSGTSAAASDPLNVAILTCFESMSRDHFFHELRGSNSTFLLKALIVCFDQQVLCCQLQCNFLAPFILSYFTRNKQACAKHTSLMPVVRYV
jgi:hypothetical protein